MNKNSNTEMSRPKTPWYRPIPNRKRRAQSCATNTTDVGEQAVMGMNSKLKKTQRRKSAQKPKRPSKAKGPIVDEAEHQFRTHICSECRRCFKSRSHLVEHMHLHFPDPSLQCPTCKRHFTSKSKLGIHMLREAGQKLHHCHLCDYGAVERNSLRRHLSNVHGEQAGAEVRSDKYPCPTCGETFQQSKQLKAHMKVHNVPREGQLSCLHEGCSFQTTEKRDLQGHLGDTHNMMAVECRHHACSALFLSAEAMEAHTRTHQAFHCTECDFSCSNKTLFQQHKRKGHAGKEELNCGFCAFTTFNPVEFDQHVGHFHANEKAHRCQQCDFVTAHKRVLTRHMLLHTGEKPHKCKICDFRCRDETYLSKHMLTHSDDKNHMCSVCGYVTKWKQYLSVHMRKHSGDLRYKCNQCSYRCHRTDQLNSHKLRHQAKSLICEVCAYSCKRKSELRKHMQLKHCTREQPQPPVFQCKYCPHQSRYRQALRNHENSKHTRSQEFRCALCSYCTYSNTGLFLHKKKAHGYVPGDTKWLENYAEKQRENAGLDPLQGLFLKAGATSAEAEGSSAGNVAGSQDDLSATGSGQVLADHQDVIAGETIVTLCEGQEQLSVHSGVLETIVESDANSQTVSVQELAESQQCDDNYNESCCTLVLTPVSDDDSSQTTTGNTQSLAAASEELQPVDGKMPVSREPVSEQHDVEFEECDSAEPTEAPSLHPACDVHSSSEAPPGSSEAVLSAMKKQDKEQADALVLEGRVQMLVVQTQTEVYRCGHCSYVTRKQTSLRRHCRRSSCGAPKAESLCCSACGAKFKQQRGLNTHRLKKCAVLLKKRKRFHVAPARFNVPNEQEKGEVQTFDNTVSVNVNNSVGRRNEAGASTTSTSTAVNKEQVHTTEPCSEGGGQAYTEIDGKFTCKTCSLTSTRLTTIERHCSSCQKSKPDSNDSNPEEGEENWDDENNNTKGAGKEKSTKRFSCSTCSFTCSQQRALESHGRRGCLKPRPVQCQSCSFVAKSQKALTHHTRVHKKEKPHPAPKGQGRKPQLQCESCSFSCKQARCMAQHVALKHEGAKPHSCRFCDFRTTRRYRLEAHESLHTGLGRQACDLCDQTFGTTSKLRLHRQRVHERRATHFCQLCDYGGYSPNDLSRHTQSCHTGELNHTCSQCEARFSSGTALKQHQNRKHNSQPTQTQTHTCAQCSFTCRSRRSLKDHLQQKHPQLDCSTCQVSFETAAALEEHRKTHLTQRCPECPFATRKRQLLAQHLLDEHEGEGGPAEDNKDKSLKCEVCGFACRHQLVFDQHIRSHGGVRLYKCTECTFSTRNQHKITWHIRTHTGEKPYRCTQCSYSCGEPSRLKYHMRIHQEERKYLCPECGYKCKWVSQLKYHMTKHTGAKPHACDECEYRTNRADALRVHQETRHRDVRSFICEKCGKAFKTRFLLKTHQMKHGEERPFVCNMCPKAFRWAAGLKNHYLTHTNQQPYQCLHCSYRARQRFQVVKHLRRHHPDEPVEEGVERDPDTVLTTLQEARLTVPVEQPDNTTGEEEAPLMQEAPEEHRQQS